MHRNPPRAGQAQRGRGADRDLRKIQPQQSLAMAGTERNGGRGTTAADGLAVDSQPPGQAGDPGFGGALTARGDFGFSWRSPEARSLKLAATAA
jgi:hypothetical protein